MTAGGAIVNISSITGYIGRLRGASLYGASKAGLVAFTRYLAVELAPKGIRVNGLAPGYIDVPMSPSMRAISGGEDAVRKQVPLDRLGGTEEMAEIVEFLLSDRSSYINGETILADGGVRSAERSVVVGGAGAGASRRARRGGRVGARRAGRPAPGPGLGRRCPRRSGSTGRCASGDSMMPPALGRHLIVEAQEIHDLYTVGEGPAADPGPARSG